MPGDNDPGAAVLLEPTYRTQPRLQAAVAVVRLDPVVSGLLGSVPGRWEQLSSSTIGEVTARSVTTSTGATFVVPMAHAKNRCAAVASRRGDTNTSITWLNWSIAR
jgi:hypothetical protein